MNICRLNTGYLDHTLSAEEEKAYESHLAECLECREKTYEWGAFERTLATLASTRPLEAVTVKEAEALMQQASEPAYDLLRPLVIVTAPLAAAACLLAIALWASDFLSSPEVITVPSSEVIVVSPESVANAHRKGLRTPLVAPETESLVATIDADRVGLSPGGEMRVLEARNNRVRIRLKQGTVACSVSPRRNSGRFVVEAGEYEVRVLGTRFAVTTTPSSPFNVLVEKGTVEVLSTSGVSWTLRKGDVLAVDGNGQVVPRRAIDSEIAMLGDLLTPRTSQKTVSTNAAPKAVPTGLPVAVTGPSPPNVTAAAIPRPSPTESAADATGDTRARSKTPSPRPRIPLEPLRNGKGISPSPETASPAPSDERLVWRQWILEGRTTDARMAMRKHLDANAEDSRTWALLADCERKQRNWYSAVSAYEKVIAHGKPKEASHAKYMSAAIYQERLNDHERAVALFKDYRQSGYIRGELKDLTDVKMARSLIALGRCDEATKVLHSVIENQGDSFVAGNAKNLLKKCTGAR